MRDMAQSPYATLAEELEAFRRARATIASPRRWLHESGVYCRGPLGKRRPYYSRVATKYSVAGALARALYDMGFPSDAQCGYPWFYSNETALKRTFEIANGISESHFLRMEKWCAEQDYAAVLAAFDKTIEVLQHQISPTTNAPP